MALTVYGAVENRFEFFIIGIVAIIFSLVLGIIGLSHEEKTPCHAPPGAKAQWVDYRGGKNPAYYVYLTHSENSFCRINDSNLYKMGIGYTTTKPYDGIVEEKP